MEHYFIPHKYNKSDISEFGAVIYGRPYTFYTLKGLFNYHGVDDGTMALLNAIVKSGEHIEGKVLDIGCGVGVIGIAIAKNYRIDLTLSDVNSNAIDIAKLNVQRHNVPARILQSNAFESIKDKFDYIVTNPPIRAGKKVLFDIVLGAYHHLEIGGKIILVIRKDLGMDSLRKAMVEKFGNCEILNRDKGYYVLSSTLQEELAWGDDIDKNQDIFREL